MKRPRLLVTGFSSFPGARRNPTETLISRIDVARLGQRLDTDLSAVVLPTEYDAVEALLPTLWSEIRPDAVVHFGLHGRADSVRVETRAKNHISPVRPDAAGCRPRRPAIMKKGPSIHRTTLPVAWIAAGIRRRGIPSVLSPDAGGYLCNYASYLSLHLAKDGELAGFIHCPWPAEERAARAPSRRPTWNQLAVAAETAIAITSLAVRRRRIIP